MCGASGAHRTEDLRLSLVRYLPRARLGLLRAAIQEGQATDQEPKNEIPAVPGN